jgi:hypothetical protein
LVNERRDAPGAVMPIPLDAPVRLASLDAEIVLRHTVLATLHPGPPAADGDSLVVTWKPADGGAFPRFRGRMWISCDVADATDTSWLRLEGEYVERPATLRLSETGERAIGRRLAVAIAARLLGKVVSRMEVLDGANPLQRLHQ